MAAAHEAAEMVPATRFKHRKVESYLRLGRARVKGWLTGFDARLIADISRIQTEQGITGGVGEIGVHHGKLFILLYLLTHSEETAFCVDIFDMQHLNIDGSGHGSEAAFFANLTRHTGAKRQIHVIKSSSESVSARDITDACGPIRLFSIDGGHTASLTKNDLELAAPTLCAGGVIIIDDYFQPAWPGVSEGVFRFFQDHPNDLVPFAISLNKVFFCRPDYADLYRSRLQARRAPFASKTSELLGYPVAIFSRPRLRAQMRNTRMWRMIRTTLVGRIIKGFVGIFTNN